MQASEALDLLGSMSGRVAPPKAKDAYGVVDIVGSSGEISAVHWAQHAWGGSCSRAREAEAREVKLSLVEDDDRRFVVSAIAVRMAYSENPPKLSDVLNEAARRYGRATPMRFDTPKRDAARAAYLLQYAPLREQLFFFKWREKEPVMASLKVCFAADTSDPPSPEVRIPHFEISIWNSALRRAAEEREKKRREAPSPAPPPPPPPSVRF